MRRIFYPGVLWKAAVLFTTLHAVAPADVRKMCEGLVSLEMVPVGNPGNSPDDTGYGAVLYSYQIGKYEVTAAQYVEFLNAKAKSGPDGGLWNNDMDKGLSGGQMGSDVRRTGELGAYTYRVEPEYANRPVTHVSYWDACRFCNWLHNGQGDGDTETGAYTLHGYTGSDGRRVHRNLGATWFVPTDNEWYKAAYYDPNKPGGAGYWDYPTRSDVRPGRDINSGNAANFYDAGFFDATYRITKVGMFSKSMSPYGTLDQGGNVFEWSEGLSPPFLRTLWGGSSHSDDGGRNAPAPNQNLSSNSDQAQVGFRVAAALPDSPIPVIDLSHQTSSEAAADADFPRRPWRNPETGKPFFPLGWFEDFSWSSRSRGDLSEFEFGLANLEIMSGEGANMVLLVNAPTDVDDESQLTNSITQMRKYLDRAQQLGIRVLPVLGGWYSEHRGNGSNAIARQERWVKAVCDHPALLGYQVYDEPEYRSSGGLGFEEQKELREFVTELGKTRDAIRDWDPNRHHLVQVVFNLVLCHSLILG